MAKSPQNVRTRFVCQSCGTQAAKWVGRCQGCQAWGTVVEETAVDTSKRPGRSAFGSLSAGRPQRLTDVDATTICRRSTGLTELDRVLGGGLVPGSLVLVGGDPGIGKSTLLLQASDSLASGGQKLLYVTGEESPQQTRMRFDRLEARADDVWLVAETSLERIERHIDDLKPDVVVVDSIQTLFADAVQSAPGSVGQLREVTARLLGLAKGRNIATFLVGHVTKDGSIAGPRVLEHMVDTVLYFEGEKGNPFRILRAVKNRFGSTNEIGAFEMRGRGLIEVSNPSALFLAERARDCAGSVVVASFEGTRPILVEVQALVSPSAFGTPRRACIGADGGRVALLMAVLEKKAGLAIGDCDVFVNVAGGIRLDEPAADLAIVVALASSHYDRSVDADTVFFGEVGLGGEIRGVAGADARTGEASKMGFKRAVLPAKSAEHLGAELGASDSSDFELLPVARVVDALDACLEP